MGIKSLIGGIWARRRVRAIEKESRQAWKLQHKTFQYLIKQGAQTGFGKAHQFDQIHEVADFQQRVTRA